MRIHKLIKNTALLAMAFPLALFTSCSDGHEDDITDSDGGTEVTNDYTATTNVKNAVITDEYEYNGYESVHKSITIYEDFNHRYILYLHNGDIKFEHYTRRDGSWYNNCSSYYGKFEDKTNQSGIINCGKVSSIDEIETKIAWNDTHWIDNDCYSYATVQPYNGYSCAFITEDDLINNMRIFVTEYTLDSFGKLESINIEYQLF